jgi:hypothetical protein
MSEASSLMKESLYIRHCICTLVCIFNLLIIIKQMYYLYSKNLTPLTRAQH